MIQTAEKLVVIGVVGLQVQTPQQGVSILFQTAQTLVQAIHTRAKINFCQNFHWWVPIERFYSKHFLLAMNSESFALCR